MCRTYFTRKEAKNEIGRKVIAKRAFPSVPEGTIGTVIKAKHFVSDHWILKVKWVLPRPVFVYHTPEFHFFKRTKPITDDFSKSDFQTLVKLT